MTDYALAANVIEQFEGYLPVAKWDVNAYRLGYGSDTEGPDQVKVTKGMHTTRERAFQNLEARIPQFEGVIIHQVGAVAWGALPPAAQANLLSMAYNYGDLPNGVERAVIAGSSLAIIASAVEAHAGDNDGVNRARRLTEAKGIASAKFPAQTPAEPAPAAKPAGLDVSNISDLQSALNILVPENPLVVDGSFGAQSVAKMKAFQASIAARETGDLSFFSVLAVYEALKAKGVSVRMA
jgi:hypothetical protein